MKTDVKLSPAARWSGAKWSLKAKLLLVLGRLHEAVHEGRDLLDVSRLREKEKQAGRLSKDQVESLVGIQSRAVGPSTKARSRLMCTDQTVQNPKQMQHKGCRLLKEFLESRPDVKSVANIGARVDVVSSYLAPRFPSVQFVSVDFQPELAAHNAGLPQSPNWTFLDGYAIDLFEQAHISADAVFLTSTACLFNNAELNTFFDVIKSAGVKHVVINEPWWPPLKALSLATPSPEDVPIDDPYVSGSNIHYHPNYGAKLERAGYKVTTAQMVEGPSQEYSCFQIIAIAEGRPPP